jgi:hypothetical protein
VNEMKIPGFTAESSLYKMSACYQSVAVRGYSNEGLKVISQLSIDPFPVSHGLGLFDDIGSWICRGFCYLVWAHCVEGCEGTWENPKPSLNCVICDENYRACLQGCG